LLVVNNNGVSLADGFRVGLPILVITVSDLFYPAQARCGLLFYDFILALVSWLVVVQ
jgi:hypothetical protein